MSNTIHVATRKGLFTVARTGPRTSRWAIQRADFLGDNVSMMLADPRDGRLYAALELGHFGVKLHRSEDRGASWTECGVPAYPAQPEGELDTDPMGRPIPWSTVKIWALEAGGAGESGVLWCGTAPGGLFRSPDHGSTWELQRALWDDPRRKEWFGGGLDIPAIHSICIDPRDARTIRLGISCGGVWKTTDSGGSWDCSGRGMWAAYMPPDRKDDPNIQDPHRLAQCQAEPDSLWVQHHNGIFHSIDGGSEWTDVGAVAPSNFGFAVAVHPLDGNTAWFVPAKSDERRVTASGEVVVTRTRDGGQTFETLADGLPQTNAYDIVYRHCLDVDETGERLAFGSTTGSLWVSEDQGESWQSVSTHLPPVYCVRFEKGL